MIEKYPTDIFDGLSQLAGGLDMSCAPVLFVICGAGLLPVGAAATADFDF
jgi:hypothetical protein